MIGYSVDWDLGSAAHTEQQDEAHWGLAGDFLEALSDHADDEDSAAQELLNIIFSL